MFKHILVPIDLSGRHARALTAALALARQSRARVTLLHVIQSVQNVPPGELGDFYRELARASLRKLERVAKRFQAKRRADLVVMGSHEVRPGRPSTGWGTTSYKVGIFCRCPILLVK